MYNLQILGNGNTIETIPYTNSDAKIIHDRDLLIKKDKNYTNAKNKLNNYPSCMLNFSGLYFNKNSNLYVILVKL